MAAISSLGYFYLAHLSKPAGDRLLYRAIRRRKIRRILEIGLGPGTRALRLIRTAQRYAPPGEVRYTAIDLFEARSASDPGLSLKEAHQRLARSGARVQLLPGDPFTALARGANALQNTDLVLIAAGLNAESLARSWFYVPRMLHAGSLVFEESLPAPNEAASLATVDALTIQARAGQHSPRLNSRRQAA